jgi:hypothetical protein
MPAPYALSSQLKQEKPETETPIRWKGADYVSEHGDSDKEEEGLEGETKKKQGKAARKKAQASKARPKKAKKAAGQTSSKAAPKGKCHAVEGCKYAPGSYAKARIEYIQQLTREQNAPFRVASKSWNVSSERAQWLDKLPRSELVRRRFI